MVTSWPTPHSGISRTATACASSAGDCLLTHDMAAPHDQISASPTSVSGATSVQPALQGRRGAATDDRSPTGILIGRPAADLNDQPSPSDDVVVLVIAGPDAVGEER